MNNLNYVHLGRLNPEIVSNFEARIKPKMLPKSYQWVHFDNDDTAYYKSLFNNPISASMKPTQKAIVSAPGYGFRIHKDEPGALYALNVIIQCNPTDWVRWYDEEYIDSMADVELVNLVKEDGNQLRSRNVPIRKYGVVPYIDQLTNQQPGDVYLVNTDKYHSFRADPNGYYRRMVIQTKFYLDTPIEQFAEELMGNIFPNCMV